MLTTNQQIRSTILISMCVLSPSHTHTYDRYLLCVSVLMPVLSSRLKSAFPPFTSPSTQCSIFQFGVGYRISAFFPSLAARHAGALRLDNSGKCVTLAPRGMGLVEFEVEVRYFWLLKVPARVGQSFWLCME